MSSPITRNAPAARGGLVLGVVREIRPKQWMKNVLVFAAPVAAGVFDNRTTIVHSILAFVCFCAAASATYLVNDITDVAADRRHPTKRNRPIAAGIVPIPLAAVLAVTKPCPTCEGRTTMRSTLSPFDRVVCSFCAGSGRVPVLTVNGETT